MFDIVMLVGGGSAQQRRHRKQVSLGAEDVVDRVSVHMIVIIKQLRQQTYTLLITH